MIEVPGEQMDSRVKENIIYEEGFTGLRISIAHCLLELHIQRRGWLGLTHHQSRLSFMTCLSYTQAAGIH
jgi:hypothetical protein